MPTYTVNYSGIELSAEQKAKIVKFITTTHHAATGAPACFAQVIFNGLARGDHFIGGEPVVEPQMFLHGQIRAGRVPEVKEKLIVALRDALLGVTGLDKTQVWVYLLELVPQQMIEYGEILPLSGREPEWLAGLPAQLQKKLADTEK